MSQENKISVRVGTRIAQIELHRNSWFILLLTLGLAWGLGLFMANYAPSLREMVIAVLGVLFIAIGLTTDLANLHRYLLVGMLTFGFGSRTLRFGDFTIHPDQLIFWILLTALLGRKLFKGSVDFSLPGGWKVLLVLVGWAAVLGISSGFSIGTVLLHVVIWFTVIPVIIVTRNLISSWEQIRNVAWVLTGAAFIIALLGVAEYFVPGPFEPFRSGFWADTPTQVTSGGWVRATFSVWGNPLAANYVAWLIPIEIYLLYDYRKESFPFRLFGVTTLVVSAVGIYISGNRGAWIVSSFSIALYALSYRRWTWLAVLVVPIAFGLLPESFWMHLINQTVVTPDGGEMLRMARWQESLRLTLENPLGNGLGSGILVHDDYLQISRDMGVPALIVFLLLGWQSIKGLWQTRLSNEVRLAGFANALLITTFGITISMLVHPVLETAALAIPVWFIYALALRVPSLIAPSTECVNRYETTRDRSY